MKHSVRYIQVDYSASGKGKSIFMLRGMEIREYDYSARRFDAILDATNHRFETRANTSRIRFTRVYPK